LLSLFDVCFFSLPSRGAANAIARLTSSTFSPSLRYLHFISFASLTDEGLLPVLQHCVLLHTLDIRACTRLTAATLGRIGELIPGLHSLNVSHITAVSDEVVTRIVQHAPALHSLHLQYTCTSSKLLPLLAQRLHLLCLNVSGAVEWEEEPLRAYKDSRDYAIQLISDYEVVLGEK